MIQPLQIRGLFLEKRFRKFDCSYLYSEKYYKLYDEQYISPLDPEIRPTYNPFEKAIFYDTKRHYDIYGMWGLYGDPGAMLIKERWYDYIANEYRLDKHVAFKGIKREFEGEIINDLVFVYFYSENKTVENLKN